MIVATLNPNTMKEQSNNEDLTNISKAEELVKAIAKGNNLEQHVEEFEWIFDVWEDIVDAFWNVKTACFVTVRTVNDRPFRLIVERKFLLEHFKLNEKAFDRPFTARDEDIIEFIHKAQIRFVEDIARKLNN